MALMTRLMVGFDVRNEGNDRPGDSRDELKV